MKRKLLSVLLVGVMTLSLAACGADKEEGTSSEENGHTLTLSAWDPAFSIPAIKAAAEDYKENVDSEFELEIVEQSGSSDIEAAIATAGSSGDYTNLPDIVLFPDHSIRRFVADYPEAWTTIGDADINWDDFSAEKIDYSTIDGEHYGVPLDNGTAVCAYRVDLLEQAGYTIDDLTGVTWDEFIEIGKAVKESTGKYLACINSDGNDYVYMMLQAEGASQFKDGKPYITENETLVKVVETIVKMVQEGVMLLPNSWSDYTDSAIQGDQVAGIMNGNWIIPTIKAVEANSGKWEITTMPTFSGEEGYASNGGSSLYITSNCRNADLAKDFLAYTFGGSTITYDNALRDGGMVSTYAPAMETDAYTEGVAYFNDQSIYSKIVEMGTHVPIIEQSDFHYSAQRYMSSAIVKIIEGADLMEALQEVEDQLNFEMGN